MNGRATAAKAPKVVSSATNIWAWVCGDRRHLARRCRLRAREEAAEPGLRGAEVPRHRLEPRRRSGRSSPSAAFRSGPRPASALPNSTRFCWIALRVGVVERVQDLVDLDRLGWAASSGRIDALGIALVRGALVDLQVLEAERRARADDDGRVLGQRVDVLVELQVDLGVDGAVLCPGSARPPRRSRPGRRRSARRCPGPACWRSAPGPRSGRSARTAGRCWRCRRGRRRGSRSGS